MVVFKNTKTDEELDELFDKIVNRLTILKDLINTVSDITEKKRINNVIKSIEFVLNYVALIKMLVIVIVIVILIVIINKNFLILNLVIQKEVD